VDIGILLIVKVKMKMKGGDEMKGRLALVMGVCLFAAGLMIAPLWAVDPPGTFVEQDEAFMTDRVLEEDLDRMPDMEHDFDRDFDGDAAEEVRQQIRKDIPELNDEVESEEDD
jgi:hypothetical protein